MVGILLLSGTGAKKVSETPKGPSLPAAVQDCFVDLPPDPVTMQVQYELVNYEFIITLNGVPTGYDVSNGPYPGWCIDYRNPIPLNTDILVKLF